MITYLLPLTSVNIYVSHPRGIQVIWDHQSKLNYMYEALVLAVCNCQTVLLISTSYSLWFACFEKVFANLNSGLLVALLFPPVSSDLIISGGNLN